MTVHKNMKTDITKSKYSTVLTKILFKTMLKIQDKDTFQMYLVQKTVSCDSENAF